MRHRRIFALSAVFALVAASLAALLFSSGLVAQATRKPVHPTTRVGAASSPASCALQVFSRTPSPNVGASGSVLTSMASTSSTDVWAVGYSGYINGSNQSLIEHFNGSAWTVIPSADPGAYANALEGITALSANNAWAVGHQQNSFSDPGGSLVEHWDGSTWSAISSANVLNSATYLSATSAISANDIWAVGYSFPTVGGPSATFTEHWDGSSWSAVPSPNQGTLDNHLLGVVGISASDAWAVGWAAIGSGFTTTVVEHWNGTAWSLVSTPSAGQTSNLFSVTALSSTDVWAVGTGWPSTAAATETLVEHWNGTAWSIVSSPNVGNGSQPNFLRAIAARSSSDVWIVGQYATDSTLNQTFTLVQHWNGTSWSILPSASFIATPGQLDWNNTLTGVVALSPTHVLVVGETDSQPFQSDAQTVVEHLGPNPVLVNCPK